jgi:hypothetical protein
VIHREDRGSAIGLVEVNWAADGKEVGLLICNWQRPLLIGWNISSQRPVEAKAFRPLIEGQLRAKYQLSHVDDVLYRACTRGGELYRHVTGK